MYFAVNADISIWNTDISNSYADIYIRIRDIAFSLLNRDICVWDIDIRISIRDISILNTDICI